GEAARTSTVAIYGEDGDALFAQPGGRRLLRAQSIASVAVESARYVAATGVLPYLGLRLRQRLGWVRPHIVAPPRRLSPSALAVLAADDEATILGCRPTPLAPHAVRPDVQERLIRGVPNDFALAIGPDATRRRIEVRLPLMDRRVM